MAEARQGQNFKTLRLIHDFYKVFPITSSLATKGVHTIHSFGLEGIDSSRIFIKLYSRSDYFGGEGFYSEYMRDRGNNIFYTISGGNAALIPYAYVLNQEVVFVVRSLTTQTPTVPLNTGYLQGYVYVY